VADAGEFTYDVRASDIYKGSPGALLRVVTGSNEIAGAVDLRPDTQYVLFVNRSEAGDTWVAEGCSGTTEVSSRVLSAMDRVLGPATPLRVAAPDAKPDDSPSATPSEPVESAAASSPEADNGSRTWTWVGTGVALLVGAAGVPVAYALGRKRSQATARTRAGGSNAS